MQIVMLPLHWVALRIQTGDVGKACGTLTDTWYSPQRLESLLLAKSPSEMYAGVHSKLRTAWQMLSFYPAPQWYAPSQRASSCQSPKLAILTVESSGKSKQYKTLQTREAKIDSQNAQKSNFTSLRKEEVELCEWVSNFNMPTNDQGCL